MKKKILAIAVTTLMCACNGNGKVDESKLNEAGEKLQKTVQTGTDSIGAKLKRLKNKIDTTRADTSKY
jgi:peptidoglycan hydrolase CwlO-like protein